MILRSLFTFVLSLSAASAREMIAYSSSKSDCDERVVDKAECKAAARILGKGFAEVSKAYVLGMPSGCFEYW